MVFSSVDHAFVAFVVVVALAPAAAAVVVVGIASVLVVAVVYKYVSLVIVLGLKRPFYLRLKSTPRITVRTYTLMVIFALRGL